MTAGFNTSSVPTPERVQILDNSLDDSFSPLASQCSDALLTSRAVALNTSKFLRLNKTTKSDFCVLQGGVNAGRRAKRDFDECIEELGDCDQSFSRNSRGDYLVQCVSPA